MSQSSQEFSSVAERTSAELDDVLQTARRLDQRLVSSIRNMVLALLDYEKERIAEGKDTGGETLVSFVLSPIFSRGGNRFEFFQRSEAARKKRISRNLQAVELEKEEARSASADALVINLESYFEAQSQTQERVPFVFHKVVPV
jgi:hypothetical protein